jgi:hypothetical protein
MRRPFVLGAGEHVSEQDRQHDLPRGLGVRTLARLSPEGDQEEGAEVAGHLPMMACRRDGPARRRPPGAGRPKTVGGAGPPEAGGRGRIVWRGPYCRMMASAPHRPEGIPGLALTGPFPVGQYAAALRERLRDFSRVQVFGEVFGFKAGRARVWFELRDARGALPCSMWRKDWEALRLGVLEDGTRVVAAGGCDYYPGSRTSSPAFSFAVADARVAGEGDLLAQLERLRRTLRVEGLCDTQARLPRPTLPRTIGVVTGESGKARDDVLAALQRRGWAGRVVWAFAPVQDRHAAPAITRALTDLAARPDVEVIVVARGGGSLADLFAFCDETLCRTVALLRVPVTPPSATTRTARCWTTSPPSRARRRRTPPRPPCPSTATGPAPPCATRPPGWSARARARSWTAPAHSPASRARPPTTWSATAPGCASSCASCAPPPAAPSRPASGRRRRAPPRWRGRPPPATAGARSWTGSPSPSPPMTPSARWSAGTSSSRTKRAAP